jgi:hypothetical protein
MVIENMIFFAAEMIEADDSEYQTPKENYKCGPQGRTC